MPGTCSKKVFPPNWDQYPGQILNWTPQKDFSLVHTSERLGPFGSGYPDNRVRWPSTALRRRREVLLDG